MKLLHELYDDKHNGGTRYRSYLKKKIMGAYPDILHFTSMSHNTPEVVICKENLNNATVPNVQCNIIKLAASYLQNDILAYSNQFPHISTPPNLQTIKSQAEEIMIIVYLQEMFALTQCEDKLSNEIIQN